MPEVILSDYFYGVESEEFIYFKIPRLLITDQKFKHVSTDAKLLYGMLLDRMGLSAKNNWYDDYGRVYIYYTVDEICEDMRCGRDKAMKLLAELDKKKGIGLVERVKQGQGRPTKLYVKRFTTRTAPSKPVASPPDNFTPCPDVEKNHPKTSEKSTSRRRKKPPQEVEKTDPNHTEGNQPDFNHPDPSIPPPKPPGAAMGMDRYELREEVKANIDFEGLQRAYPYDDVESLLELVVDVLGSTAPTLRIAGESLPADTVKQRFRKLDMKTDYITNTPALPPHMVYPRFLLGMDLRLITKEVYCILLDMVLNGETSVDKHGRRYLTFINPEIAKLIDRTPSTVGHALAELEAAGLVKRRWISRCPTQPYHTYVKLPAGEDAP